MFYLVTLQAHSLGQGTTEQYSDAVSLLAALKTENSFNFGVNFGIAYVEAGPSASESEARLTNISEYNSKV